MQGFKVGDTEVSHASYGPRPIATDLETLSIDTDSLFFFGNELCLERNLCSGRRLGRLNSNTRSGR